MTELTPPALPTQEDYRRYDRIWRKVSPELDPYPDVRAARPGPPEPPARPDGRKERCMGPAARDDLGVVEEFLRDELADAQTYRHLAALAPTPDGKRLMRALAAEEAKHAKTLRAAYYLITGRTYDVTVVLPPQPRLPWRDRLRERYHAETRAGESYARAARETPDRCLKKLFARLSQDEYRHAERLRELLERTL